MVVFGVWVVSVVDTVEDRARLDGVEVSFGNDNVVDAVGGFPRVPCAVIRSMADEGVGGRKVVG